MPIALEKAIELVSKHHIQLKTAEDHDYFDALLLLIEAGKAIQTYRKSPMGYLYLPLPGETME